MKGGDRKILLSNMFFLTLLQGVNFLLPIATFPYLVRVLGVENFGLLSFATAITMYFQIVVDYGFNLTATREISLNRHKLDKITEIFNSVLMIKFMLLCLSALVLIILIIGVPVLRAYWWIYVLSFGIVIGQALFPLWFFQGIEKMKYVSIFNIISKLVFTLAVFLFVKSTDDLFWVPIFNSFGFILSGASALLVIRFKYQVKFKLQSSENLIYYIKAGWYVFVSNLSVSLYTFSTTILLGFFTNNVIVGYYSIGDKLITAIKSINNPVAQAFFPFISKKSIESKEATLLLLNKIMLWSGGLMFFISLTVFLFSDFLIDVLFGLKSVESILVLRILAIVPFLATLDMVLGTLNMQVFQKNKEYSFVILSAGIINLILSVFLITYYQHIGAAVSVLTVELFITFSIVRYVKRSDANIFVPFKQKY